jgi:hypothetical protein
MTVKQLIEKLSELDENLNVYLSDNDLDDDTFFFQALDVIQLHVQEEELVSITFRN